MAEWSRHASCRSRCQPVGSSQVKTLPLVLGAASTPSLVLDLQDAWKLYGVHSGGVEGRWARTACELVLTGGDTDLRILGCGRGIGVAEWRWGRLSWLACWFTALLRCVCAAANGGEHTPTRCCSRPR